MQPKYGLPHDVVFCKRCVISNQRPSSTPELTHTAESKKATIHFDEEGVCDACRVAESKAKTDWEKREQALKALCDRHRRHDGFYDCVVPGSGGKDSYYAAHILKTRYDMHPLLVTWAPHLYTDWGRRNLNRWQVISDHILHTPNSNVHRILTRLAVENLFHPFQPFILGQKGLAPKVAAQYGIPLVFYGEDEAEYGNPKQDTVKPTRDPSYYTRPQEMFLGGVQIPRIMGRFDLSLSDFEPYMPASAESLKGIEVHYLGYYLKWHPQACYYYAVENGGFEASPERTPGTYSKYNSIDDKIDDLHYYTTYIKFGIGRATYDAAQEIRSGDITREEGVALVQRFDGEWPARFEDELFEYLSPSGFPAMTKERFMDFAKAFKSPHLWDGDKLRHVVT